MDGHTMYIHVHVDTARGKGASIFQGGNFCRPAHTFPKEPLLCVYVQTGLVLEHFLGIMSNVSKHTIQYTYMYVRCMSWVSVCPLRLMWSMP